MVKEERAVAETPEIKHAEIAKLREPIKNILEQMRERIDRGEYTLIIGDDASGRIPTWIFYNFFKEIYKEKNFPVPRVRYFEGGYRDDKTAFSLKRLFSKKTNSKIEEIKSHLTKLRKISNNGVSPKQKALVVTDTIASGHNSQPILDALRQQQISFDVAAVSNINYLTERFGSDGKLFSGQYNPLSIYGRDDLSGITKNPKDLFSRRHRVLGGEHKPSQHNPEVLVGEKQSAVEEARVDGKILSHELANWYKQVALPRKDV